MSRLPESSRNMTAKKKTPAKRRRLGRATYHHGDLRRALVEAAVAIIADKGAEAFTLREAARRLGVNHRAAYRHFADKTSLLAAVAEQGFAALVEGTRAEMANATEPESRLRAMARAYVDWAERHPAHFRVMFGPRLNEDGPARFGAIMQEAYSGLEAEIRGAVGSGPDAETIGDLLIAYWSLLHGLASLVLLKRVKVPRAQLPAWVDRVVGRVIPMKPMWTPPSLPSRR
jgi:AcrR family transcriptional regulator